MEQEKQQLANGPVEQEGSGELPNVLRLLELSQEMMCVVGKNGRFLWVSTPFAQTLGWSRTELRQMIFLELIHPQDKDNFVAKIGELFRQKPVAGLECRLQTADGAYRWLAWRVEGLAGGGLQAVLQDVTAVREQTAVHEKQYMQALYHITSSTAPPHIAIANALVEAARLLDLEAGVVSHIDGQTYTVQHVTAGAGIDIGDQFDLGNTYCDLTMAATDVVAIHHAQNSPHRRHPCYVLRQIEAYIGVVLFVNGQKYGVLNFSSRQPRRPFTAADKSFAEVLARWVETRLSQVETARQMETASAIHNAVLEHAGYAIIATDIDGIIRLFNPAATQLLGYKPADVVGKKRLTELHDPTELAQRGQQLNVELGMALPSGLDVLVERARWGLANVQEWMYVTKNGRFVPALLNITTLRNEQGELIGYLSVGNSLAEQQQVEQVQQEQNRLTRFMAAAGQALTQTGSLQTMLQQTAEALVRHLDIALTGIWTVDAEGDRLHLRASAGQDDQLDGSQDTISIGQGVIGRVATEKRPFFHENLHNDTTNSDLTWAIAAQFNAIAAHPLIIEDQTLGVITIFTQSTLSETSKQALATISQSIAIAVRRDNVERELRHTRRELKLEVDKRTAELSEKNILLQAQVTERDDTNTILRKRAAELEIVTRVSAAASSIAETGPLMQEVINLIKVSFDLYHAHFYVLNDIGDALVLSIGAGDVGRKLLEIGHTIPLSEPNSLVVRAALTREGVIENDLYNAPGYLANQHLPDSRSSMAIPMIVGDEVLGVLNVQSDKINHFSDEDVRIQTTLAAQIALALQHTRSLARAQTAIEELNLLTRRLSRSGWDDYFAAQQANHLGFGYDLLNTHLLSGGQPSTRSAKLEQVVQKPLLMQENRVGELLLADPQAFEEDVADILEDVGEQLTAHLENLRLAEQTRGALARTEALYASSDRLVRASTLDDILQALVESVGYDRFVSANFLFFNRAWTSKPPETFRAAAVWTNPASPLVLTPIGSIFPLEQFPSLQQLHRHEPTLFVDIEQDERAGSDLRELLVKRLNVRGLALFPLVVGQEWFGVFAGLTLEAMILNDEEVRQLRSIMDQAASVVQNLRLFGQTQQALARTEALYQISRFLNAATSLDDIAAAVVVPSVASGAVWSGVWLLERDEEKRPFSLELAGTWHREGTHIKPERLQLAVVDALPELFSDVLNLAPIFIPNIAQDKTFLTADAKAWTKTLGLQAGILLPLRYGEHVVGIATIGWAEPYNFDDDDNEQDIYQLLLAQVGVAVHSQLLLRDSRRRSAQLEKLAQIEAGLSSANSANNIIEAVVTPLALEGIHTVTLGYIEPIAQTDTLNFQIVSLWHENQFLDELVDSFPLQPLASYSLSSLWLSGPEEMLEIPDVNALTGFDAATIDAIQAQAVRDGWQALALLPLRSGGRWQGVMAFTWDAPHRLTLDEQFVLPRLLEPVAATVASQRAFQAQRAARREMAGLYEASRLLNEAADLQTLLESVVSSVNIEVISRANLWLFETIAEEPYWGARLVAAWSNDVNWPALPIGTFLGKDAAAFASFLRQTETMFVEDTNRAELPDSVQLLNRQRRVASLIILPLLIQGTRRGVIVMSAQQPHAYSDREKRICSSLLPQIAIVLENKRLLEAAQAQAEQERLLREVTEKVRHSLHVETVMKTAVEEVGRILGRRTMIYLDEPGEK